MMPDPKQKPEDQADFAKAINLRAQRKIKAKKNENRSIWFGLGMFGLVGWSIMIPTIAGIALGLWIDRQWPNQISWTLTFLFVGVILGCLNAWHWINEENRND